MRRWLLYVLPFVLIACSQPSSDDDGPAPADRCTPGLTRECTCPNGESGAQTCRRDGTFGPCSCQSGTVPDGGVQPDVGDQPPIDGTSGGDEDATGPVDRNDTGGSDDTSMTREDAEDRPGEDTGPADKWSDRDDDGFLDRFDNCPGTTNPNQTDTDADGVGDACDNCPDTANRDQVDANDDGKGDVCENAYDPERDRDGDGVRDVEDNCQQTANGSQQDPDGDRIGRVCDNCPDTSNHFQTDSNNDGIGDACTDEPVGRICKRQSSRLRRIKPNVFILMDKSGSMQNNNRMTRLKRTLDTIADRFANRVQFGLMAFNDGSCPGDFPVQLDMGDYSSSAIKSSYQSVQPQGGTALGHALEQIRRDTLYRDANDPVADLRNRAVIAVTDGQSRDEAQCQSGRVAGELFNNRDVKVHAVGLSSAAAISQLNQIASQGGTGSARQANSRSDLVSILDDIISQTSACKYQVEAPRGGTIDPNKVWVKAGGSWLDRSTYSFEGSNNLLTLSDSACQRIDTTNVGLEVQAGCKETCSNPSTEVCNYEDDDCDREVDEGCDVSPEVCDGEDNDMDAKIDEGCPDCSLRGESCDRDGACCNGSCRSNGTCGPECRPKGVNCRRGRDCCSGTCNRSAGERVGTCL